MARDGKIVHFEAVGQRGADDEAPMTKDALFRIFSMSKPITAVAAMMLYEEGRFALSDPVAEFVPELAELDILVEGELVPAERTMTMRHLLTHTGGLSYGFNPRDPVDAKYREAQPLQAKDLDEFAERLGTLPLAFEPGERWHYSVAVDVTGLVVQRLSGMSFDAFLKERLFDPLGMEDTFFNVPADKLDRLLPNHGWNREEEKLVQFDQPYEETGLFSGGGGLVSSTMDYLRFSEMVRRGGELDGVRILSPKTVQFMTANHLPSTVTGAGSGENPLEGVAARSFGFGLGFGVNINPVGAGVLGSFGEYSWGRRGRNGVLGRPGGGDGRHRDDPALGLAVAVQTGAARAGQPGDHGFARGLTLKASSRGRVLPGASPERRRARAVRGPGLFRRPRGSARRPGGPPGGRGDPP